MASIKKTPGINGSSMADISFILFIFFLMVTTMGSEFGLVRLLPPWVDTKPDDKGDKIKERNVLVVAINQHNALLVNKEYEDMTQLRARTKEFFNINNTGENFPEKEPKELPFLGTINVNATALVSLQNDRSTSYKVYIQAQNELAAAINELRDEFCLQKFGGKYENCTAEQQDVVGNQVYKMAISEAEPRDISKTKTKK